MTATPRYRWCTLHVDAPDPAPVAAEVAALLGPGSELDVFTVPGFTVDVRRNPDRTGGPHPLDRPTQVEVDADPHVPDAEVVAFTGRLIEHLRAHHRVTPESDFSSELPTAEDEP